MRGKRKTRTKNEFALGCYTYSRIATRRRCGEDSPNGDDSAMVKRVTSAVWQMEKLNLAELERAAAGWLPEAKPPDGANGNRHSQFYQPFPGTA